MFVLKLETNIQLYSRINFTQTKKTENIPPSYLVYYM